MNKTTKIKKERHFLHSAEMTTHLVFPVYQTDASFICQTSLPDSGSKPHRIFHVETWWSRDEEKCAVKGIVVIR
jgi:hypothetical protein